MGKDEKLNGYEDFDVAIGLENEFGLYQRAGDDYLLNYKSLVRAIN